MGGKDENKNTDMKIGEGDPREEKRFGSDKQRICYLVKGGKEMEETRGITLFLFLRLQGKEGLEKAGKPRT